MVVRKDGRDRKEYYRSYYLANKEKLKARRRPTAYRRGEHFKARYGITRDDYAALLRKQGGVCAICGRPPNPESKKKAQILHVDHDHASGRVRGLLCGPCNRHLPWVENTTWLARATTYLEETSNV